MNIKSIINLSETSIVDEKEFRTEIIKELYKKSVRAINQKKEEIGRNIIRLKSQEIE